jgi:hypothetical protein
MKLGCPFLFNITGAGYATVMLKGSAGEININ